MEHLYLWSGFTGWTSANQYSNYFGATPKLTKFEGDCPLISLDKRMITLDGVLCGFAPSGLTSYVFPNSITAIPYVLSYVTNTFQGDDVSGDIIPCSTSISSVTLPQNLVLLRGHFDGMTALKSLYIPDTVTKNGAGIPDGTFGCTCIGCTSLTDVYMTSGMTSFTDTFKDCTSLTSVTFGNQNEIQLWARVFSGCTSLPTIILPDCKNIGDYCFYGCTSLSSITFGTLPYYENAWSIGAYAFCYCMSLKNIYHTGTGYGRVAETAFLEVASNGTFHYKNNYPTGIMSNSPYYLGYYGWTAVNDIT